MTDIRLIFSFLLSFPLLFSCNETTNTEINTVVSTKEFKNYWHSGKAEVASYDLKQSRYGETRDGHAILIFVTEDIHEDTHIKLDNPEESWKNKTNVLKLNFTKKFVTGIYPYSMMMSVFTPLNGEQHPLKISMSVQEWCGQVFTQLNKRGGDYEVQQFSYFESDGDISFDMDIPDLSEDEVWNRIRIDYKNLPTGKLNVLPGLMTSRLRHEAMEPIKAEAALTEHGNTLHYTLRYDDSHLVKIIFEKAFPHKILGWEEAFSDSRGDTLKTTATLLKSLNIDYWTKNKNEHQRLRDSLLLNY